MGKFKKVLVSCLTIVGIVGAYFLGFFTRELSFSDVQRAVLNMIEKYEKHYYYEDEDVVNIISNAIFDKYSTYYTKEEYQSMLYDASGKNLGIGLVFVGNSLEITKVNVNSPCEKQGVKSGGKLEKIKVNGVEKTFSDLSEFIDAITDVKENENIDLTVNYGGVLRTYTVSKQEYQRSYVTYEDSSGTYNFLENGGELSLTNRGASQIIDSDVGYVLYEEFSGRESGNKGSAGQLRTALEKFKNNGKKKLILDIRDNGGGYMDVLCEVAGMLVETESNKQVVSIAKDKYQNEQLFYATNQTYNNYGFEKIVILANELSASASEVLIGAMLDYDKSNKVSVVIDGHQNSDNQTVYKTYGKGIMQSTYVNIDRSAVKVTTAEIFWPKSRISIHDKGVTTQTSNKVFDAVNGDALLYAINMLK